MKTPRKEEKRHNSQIREISPRSRSRQESKSALRYSSAQGISRKNTKTEKSKSTKQGVTYRNKKDLGRNKGNADLSIGKNKITKHKFATTSIPIYIYIYNITYR